MIRGIVLGITVASIIAVITNLYSTFITEKSYIEQGNEPFKSREYVFVILKEILQLLTFVGITSLWFPHPDVYSEWVIGGYFLVIYGLSFLIAVGLITVCRVILLNRDYKNEKKKLEKDIHDMN